MTVFLLGPGRDGAGSTDPMRARRRLAEFLRGAGALVVVMEDEPDASGENNLAKFQRLVRDHGVTTYLLHIPLGARLHGVSIEVGHLLTRIQDGALDPARVHLALQHEAAPVDDEGVLALAEPGNRTRYYEDLLDEGCPVHRWRDGRELIRHAVAVAVEDVRLRPTPACRHNP